MTAIDWVRPGGGMTRRVAVVRPLPSHGLGNISLRTERLELRPVRDEDVDRFLEYRNLPDITRWPQ